VPDAPDVRYDADALRAENGRLRMLLADKDAKIAELEELCVPRCVLNARRA